MSNFKEIMNKLNNFREERDWRQFHNPKNLAMALSVEVAEVVERFQWLTLEEAETLEEKRKNQIREELADVATFLFYLCDDLDIDIFKAIEEKIVRNAKKYPIEKAKGSAKKYNEL